MNYIFIACKSDPAELPKSWFSVKNITEKLWNCQLDLGRFLFIFLYICIHNRQSNSAAYVKKAVKATADIKPLKINFDKL